MRPARSAAIGTEDKRLSDAICGTSLQYWLPPYHRVALLDTDWHSGMDIGIPMVRVRVNLGMCVCGR